MYFTIGSRKVFVPLKPCSIIEVESPFLAFRFEERMSGGGGRGDGATPLWETDAEPAIEAAL